MTDDPIKCRRCEGGFLKKENMHEQTERIKAGLKNMFPYEKDERIEQFAANYIGYGPNYMFKCDGCGVLKKIIPDGRDRND